MSGKKGADPSDPVAEVDAMVTAVRPDLGMPSIERLDAVLVTGPWLAGVTGVVVALRERLPKKTFVEAADLAAGEAPAAVVFVVSAAALLTESDCALLDAATAETDAVIGAVSKIDVHQNWEETLAGNREVLASYAPRYADVPWAGVAAAPEEGEPRIDDLAAAVSDQLSNADLARRNRLRAWQSRLQTVADRYDRDADGAGRRVRVEALREQRSEILRQRRLSKSERTIALRSQTQQARTQLSYFARNRCASVRSELQEDAAGRSRGKLPEFEADAKARLQEVIAEVDDGTEYASRPDGADPGAGSRPAPVGPAADGRHPVASTEVTQAGEPVDDAAGRRLRAGGGADPQPTADRPDRRAHDRGRRRVCGDRARRSRSGWWGCVGCSATGLCSTDGPARPPRWCSPRSSRWWRRGCWPPSRR